MAMAMSAMDKEIKEYIDKNKAINTVKKTKSDLNIWFRWCKTVNEKRKLEEISVEELNSLLGHFFINIKKQNGEEYEPNSLTSLQSSIDRHLREAGRMYSILFDREFETSRKALEAKRKELRREGKGCKQNAAEPLTKAEQDKLWAAGQLGGDNPLVLLHTIWFLCTMHFGWRGVDEHRRVCFGDMVHGVDDENIEFFEMKTERGTKTRNGAVGQHERAFNPRMYATGGDRCPVKLMKKYLGLRPPHCCLPNSPFYLQPANTPVTSNSLIWYKNQPVGINTLSNEIYEKYGSKCRNKWQEDKSQCPKDNDHKFSTK
jgi:hypothetical protein